MHSLSLHCQVGRMDIKHAFLLCPVRPVDWQLLGMFWQDHYFIDTRLPFGSRSSPYIFNTFVDAFPRIVISLFAVPYLLQYLDDFFLVDNNKKLSAYMDTIKEAFHWLGVPLAPDKLEGPPHVSCITYLGIQINSCNLTISLPPDKLTSFQSELTEWSHCCSCRKQEFLSLIDKLSFAAKIMWSLTICFCIDSFIFAWQYQTLITAYIWTKMLKLILIGRHIS